MRSASSVDEYVGSICCTACVAIQGLLLVGPAGTCVNDFNCKICTKKLRTENIQHANRYLFVWVYFSIGNGNREIHDADVDPFGLS
jgi:hypothetical protein